MRRLTAAAVAATVLAAGACSGDDTDKAAPARSTTTASSTTTTSTTTTLPPSTTTTPPNRPPATPEEAAATVVATESAIRNPATSEVAIADLGPRQQLAYRAIAANPAWDAAVRARVPAGLRGVVDANVGAGRELKALTKPRTSLPPWRIVAPAPAPELLGYDKEAERTRGVPWQYLAAIHLVETRMGRIRGTSPSGAQGPMQFLPSTWSAYGNGGDINSNHDAVMAAARYLQRNGAPGNMANALWNYNHSDHYVRAVTAYAEQMRADERAYFGYYNWQVYYALASGDVLLPVGYGG